MGTTLNRHAYQRLIDENLEWLSKQPRSLERDHIEGIIKRSLHHEYEVAEQFDALRKASEVALKWMDWWLDSELCECDGHGHICGKTERRREADALRRALGKQD